MVKKKAKTGGKRRGGKKKVVQHGESAFTDFFTKTIPNAARSAHSFVKRNKLISKGLSLIPGVPAKVASVIADKVGYGKREERRTRQKGGGRGPHKVILM